jgi:TolB protein
MVKNRHQHHGWMGAAERTGSTRQIAAFTSFAQCYPIARSGRPTATAAIVTDQGGQPLCQGWSEAVFQGTNISLVETDTGFARTPISGGAGGSIDPSWSPDGSMLAFVSNRSGTAEIWTINADGSNLRQLTNAGQYVRFPIWRRP